MNKIEVLSKKALCAFLVIAKINTFASENSRIISKNTLSKNYLYVDGAFRYEDQYYGEYVDVGQETVWYLNVPVWAMTYRGGIHKECYSEKTEAFGFLKEALKKPEEKFPTRGPRNLIIAPYHYINLPEGDILNFSGKEIVTKNQKEICFRSYLGGIIYGKFNKDMILTP